VHGARRHDLPCLIVTRDVIYLDSNATTRPSVRVVDAMAAAGRELWANPSSVHRAGQEARRAVELARERVSMLIEGSKPREIIFTSGGTEALDLAIRGSVAARAASGAAAPGVALITTPVEHAAIRDLGDELARLGVVERVMLQLRSDQSGIVDVAAATEVIAALRAKLASRPPAQRGAVMVVQWANNETGAIQPVRELAGLARSIGAPFICDATQWVGKCPTRVGAAEANADDDALCPCDAIVCAPHKFHGPKGVGILWASPSMRLRPTLLGTQEMGRRGGTENTAAIIGAGVACDEAAAWLKEPAHRARLESLRDTFEEMVLARVQAARVHRTSNRRERLWNTSSIAFPRLEAEALLLALSERGVCASAGAACSSGSLEPSPVLLAMGIYELEAHGTLRFSLSRETTREELATAAEAIADVVQRLSRLA
jgi:cysteine desulfurase